MVFYSYGEISSKKFAENPTFLNGIITYLIYSFSTICWLACFKQYSSLTVLGTIWSILCIVIGMFIGLVVYHEPVTTIKIIGLIFGVISIILLSL